GGLLFVLFRQAGTVSVHHLLGFIVLGTLAAVAFALLEIRLHQYLDHYRKVVAHYERRFGLTESLYHPERRTWLFQGRLAVLMFIAGSMGLWIFLGILVMPVSKIPV
ncbi:MAG: hypothetical protein WBX21_16845, partial [Aestuariivirga sp.]